MTVSLKIINLMGKENYIIIRKALSFKVILKMVKKKAMEYWKIIKKEVNMRDSFKITRKMEKEFTNSEIENMMDILLMINLMVKVN